MISFSDGVEFEVEIDDTFYSEREIRELIRDSKWLQYLVAAGIENSEAYGEAVDAANEESFFDNV